ncbi:MAG: 4Fe-4S binding protein, partial [Candidatus Bathyarchaeia archaeon]
IPVGPAGFFSEAHVKLRPAETVTDGIFIAGTCHGPKDIVDVTAYATGAGLAAASLMSRGMIEAPPIIVEVDESLCSGCKTCESLCEYGAIEVSETENVAKVTPAKCKGCGVCVSACPSKAIRLNHFTDQQLLAMVRAAYS